MIIGEYLRYHWSTSLIPNQIVLINQLHYPRWHIQVKSFLWWPIREYVAFYRFRWYSYGLKGSWRLIQYKTSTVHRWSSSDSSKENTRSSYLLAGRYTRFQDILGSRLPFEDNRKDWSYLSIGEI